MRRWLTASAIATGVLVGLFVLAACIRGTPQFDSAGDGAALSLRTLEATRTRQLLGPYSQFGWNHPGPMMFYLMAPLFYLTHYHEMSLRWMAFVFNVLSLSGILVLARRHSAWLVLVMTGALLLFFGRAGGEILFSDWNPHITLLPLAFFVFLCAELAVGHVTILPLATFVGSFVAQSHLGFVPVVAVLAFSSLMACRRTMGPDDADRGRFRRAVNGSAWFVVLLWCLPLAEEIVHNPNGNIDRIINFLREPHDHLSIATALGLFGHYGLGPFGPTFMLPIGADAPMESPIWQPIAVFALIAAAGAGVWLAMRRGQRFTASLGLLALVGCAVGLFSVYSIPTRVFDHQVFWVSLFVLLAVAAAMSAAFDVWVRSPHLGRGVATIVSGLAVSALVFSTVRQMRAWQTDVSRDRRLNQIYSEFHEYLAETKSRAPEIRHTASTWDLAVGLVLQFATHHDPVRIDDDLVHIAVERYRVTDKTTDSYLLFDVNRDTQITIRPDARMQIHVGSLALVNTKDLDSK